MGFSENAAKRALLATNNGGAEEAMNWLFGHMDDAGMGLSLSIQTETALKFQVLDLNDPLPGAKASGPEPSADQIAAIADMGFTLAQARKALKETGGSPERAIEWLFSHPDETGEEETAGSSTPKAAADPGGSATLPPQYTLKAFISHKGPSVHSGHYVAHIKTEKDGWVLFNDEKVVKASSDSVEELKKLAYLYIFVRD